MTRETKVGLLIGMGVILLIGIIVSDTLTDAQFNAPDLTDSGERNQESIFRPGPNEAYADRGNARNDASLERPRRNPIPAPDDINLGQGDMVDERNLPDRRRQAPAPRPLPTALAVDGPEADETRRTSADRPDHDVPTLHLSHDRLLNPLLADGSADRDASDTRDRRTQTDDRGTSEPSIARTRDTGGDSGPAGSQIIHYVKRGETLYDIARKYYGSGEYWRSLAAVNRDTVGENGRVVENARLVIPSRSGLVLLNDDFEPAGTERVVRVDTSSRPQQARTIKVEPGDTLSALASEHLGSSSRWRELLEANGDQLDSANELKAGMTLKLPGAAPSNASNTSATRSPQREARSAGGAYTVRAGDSLTRIAERELGDGGRWRDIYEANRDAMASPDSLKVGQTLRLPR
ncbi:MAG: LysM peptidoglycan-binding domain-containing protein [Phycisphaeraceae bacterium]